MDTGSFDMGVHPPIAVFLGQPRRSASAVQRRSEVRWTRLKGKGEAKGGTGKLAGKGKLSLRCHGACTGKAMTRALAMQGER